jgi:anti-sigma regulatory factor (Ser/Thr protein kinase)
MARDRHDGSIRIPQRFGPAAFAEWLTAWKAVCDLPEITLVLPSEALLEPAGVVLLAAGIARRRLSELKTRFDLDPDSDSAIQLQRIQFFHALGIEAPISRGAPPARSVELRCITDENVAAVVAAEIAAALNEELPDAASSVRRWAKFLLEELGVNIVQHSGAPRTGFGVAHGYARERRFQIAFADAGQGFLSTVQRNPEFAGRVQDEGEALQLALNEGLTFSTSAANMSVGLGALRAFSDELHADLCIASGEALLHRRTLADRRVSTIRTTHGWPGAWICLDAPPATPKG